MTRGLAMTSNSVALHPAVGGSILLASVISIYCMYLCYSGLSSEPRDCECNGLHRHSKAISTGSLTLGLLTTTLSVVYSAIRAGSSTTLLSPPSSPRAGSGTPLLPLENKADEHEEKENSKPALIHLIQAKARLHIGYFGPACPFPPLSALYFKFQTS
ncbi:uncharacterized protein [Rutidosis leptorrhynchoides]|uniref:uncharacterized protein n=1 Tax=Rutidosis leptorrhynchoides TaxID=125765 RepID=UPI003A99801F